MGEGETGLGSAKPINLYPLEVNRRVGLITPLIEVAALELPLVADVNALSVSDKVADGFKLFKAATPPDTNAVAGEVPAMVFQQSKLFPSEHKLGSAYWLS